MAVKRKKRATTPVRRRRRTRRPSVLSGVDFDATHIIGTAAGSATASYISKFMGNLDPKIQSVIKIGAGIMLPMLAKKGKTKATLQSIGGGMIAVGTLEFLQASGIAGFGQPSDDMMFVSLTGAGDLPVLNEDVLGNMDEDLPVLNEDVLAMSDDDLD